nr:hypothetical protein [Tanacetum cinerariifolium]
MEILPESTSNSSAVEHISSPPQAPPAPLSSPPQAQPTKPADTSESLMTLLNKLMETCATLTQKVAHLEQDKVAQALEITKLKQRVRKLESKRRSKHSGLKRLRKVELDADEDVTLVDVDTVVEIDADIQGRMEQDVIAVKEVNAAEPTVFDDEEVRPIFKREYNNVQTFLKSDRDEEPTKKRHAKETLLQESFKKLSAEVEVLGSRTYWRMIKVGGIKQAYQSLEDMLKEFYREDLDALWRLVKERFSTTLPTHDKEKALWAELTRLYEPNANDVFWKL